MNNIYNWLTPLCWIYSYSWLSMIWRGLRISWGRRPACTLFSTLWEVGIQPRVVEQLFRRASFFGAPFYHSFHKLNEHPLVFAVDVIDNSIKAYLGSWGDLQNLSVSVKEKYRSRGTDRWPHKNQTTSSHGGSILVEEGLGAQLHVREVWSHHLWYHPQKGKVLSLLTNPTTMRSISQQSANIQDKQHTMTPRLQMSALYENPASMMTSGAR